MNVTRLGFFASSLLLVAPLAQAHPGHEHHGGMLASLMHALVTSPVSWLMVSAGLVLWTVNHFRRHKPVSIQRDE